MLEKLKLCPGMSLKRPRIFSPKKSTNPANKSQLEKKFLKRLLPAEKLGFFGSEVSCKSSNKCPGHLFQFRRRQGCLFKGVGGGHI